jgi:hypothetical protein
MKKGTLKGANGEDFFLCLSKSQHVETCQMATPNNKPFMVMKWYQFPFFCYVEKVHDYFQLCSLVANELNIFFFGFPLKPHMIGIITSCLSWLLKSGP